MSSTKAWSKNAPMKLSRLGWLAISIVVIVFDRISKMAILDRFMNSETLEVTPFFSLILTFNTGAAFSFFSGAGKWFFVVVGVAVCAVLVGLLLKSADKLFCIAASMIVGGALGNIWDRLQYGRVVDFLLFHYKDWFYPAFNLADCAIVLGAAFLLMDSIKSRREDS
jgi:signal peptidase II